MFIVHVYVSRHITAPPSVCVFDVIGALDVWIQNQKNKKTDIFFVLHSLVYMYFLYLD